MAYQPSLKDLLDLIEYLKKNYTGTNVQRLSFIALLDELAGQIKSNPNSKKMIKLLMGLASYELEAIHKEYSYLSPEWSEMYSLIIKKLGISTENKLGNDERLYYLTKLFNYVEKHVSEECIQAIKAKRNDLVWEDKKKLLKDIHEVRKYLRHKHSKQIAKVVNATPELLALQQRTEELLSCYPVKRDIQNRIIWIKYQKNAKREKHLNFVRTIHQSCSRYFPFDEQSKLPHLQKAESNVRQGLLLFEVTNIESEYDWWLISPQGGFFNKGSSVSQGSLAILNNLKDHDYDERINWLRALSDHLKNLQKDKTYYTEIVKEWQEEGKLNFTKELDYFQDRIQRYIKNLETLKNTPSRFNWLLATGTGYGTQYGLTYAVKTAFDWGASTYVNAGINALAITLGGPAGAAIVVGGQVLSIAFSYTITKGMISAATSTISACLLDRVSSGIGNKTADLVSNYLFSPTKEGFWELRNKLNPEDEKVFCRFVNTLLQLPNDTVSDEEKEHIRMVLPIRSDGKLQPLSRREENKMRFFSETKNLSLSIQTKDYHAPTSTQTECETPKVTIYV